MNRRGLRKRWYVYVQNECKGVFVHKQEAEILYKKLLSDGNKDALLKRVMVNLPLKGFSGSL